MKNLLLIFLLITSFAYSQKTFTNTRDSIYMSNGLFYTLKNNSLFDGTIEHTKKNGVIISREIYENGFLKKKFFYYNKSARGKVYLEIQYGFDSVKSFIQKELYYNSNEELFKIKSFNSDGLVNVTLYENGKISYSCDYKAGKKDGIETCYDKENNLIQFHYENGKKVKNKT